MPYAVKKPHPTVSGAKIFHTWDPDGDGYECIRKFRSEAKAQAWIDEFHPDRGCEIVEVDYEISQDDDELAMREAQADDETTTHGVMSLYNRDEQPTGRLSAFTPEGDFNE